MGHVLSPEPEDPVLWSALCHTEQLIGNTSGLFIQGWYLSLTDSVCVCQRERWYDYELQMELII